MKFKKRVVRDSVVREFCKTLFEMVSITFGQMSLQLDNIVMKLEKN